MTLCAGEQQEMFDSMGEYDDMDPMMQQQIMQMQMMQARGMDPYAGMDPDQQDQIES
jgi:hypothetical protein